MREAHESSPMTSVPSILTQRRRDAEKNHQILRGSASLRRILPLLVVTAAAHAAVTGVVINRSTGKPQPGATVALNQLAQQAGITLIDQAKSDSQGRFSIATDPKGGPHLLRTAYDGVTYNHMLPPGSPTTDITLDVYNASKSPGGAKVGKHMILLEPNGGQMTVSETLFVNNTGKTAWNNPD